MKTLDLFRNETVIDQYATGQVIFEEGQPGDKMYVSSPST